MQNQRLHKKGGDFLGFKGKAPPWAERESVRVGYRRDGGRVNSTDLLRIFGIRLQMDQQFSGSSMHYLDNVGSPGGRHLNTIW
jgi:hypothetical protein